MKTSINPARPVPLCSCILAVSFALFLTVPPLSAANPTDYQQKRTAIRKLINETMANDKLQAVLLGVSVEGKELLILAEGETMTGVPATADMHFRNGNVAVAYMGNLFYQLVDAGIVKADDPVGKWLPDLPESQTVTLEMLINGTAGYPDFMPMNLFQKKLYSISGRRRN